MKVNSISSNVAFKSLYSKVNLSELKTDKLKNEYTKILNLITSNKLDKKKFADVTLNYDSKNLIFGGGFYGIISDKHGNVPRNSYKMLVSSNEKDANRFISWVKEWNSALNPIRKEGFWRVQRYAQLVIAAKKPIPEAEKIIDREAKLKPWLNLSFVKLSL